MTSQLRKLKAIVLGHNLNMDTTTANLEEANVPVSRDSCRACADPCDLGHDDYPSRFEVDMETEMLGSMKPYRRQVVISTGKSDWPHDVTSESGSLASYLDSALSSAPKGPKHASNGAGPKVNGVYDSTETARVTVLNGSHHTLSEDPKRDTVLVLPDYKVVTEVPRSREGADELYRDVVDPARPRAGAHIDGAELQSYVLPYSCVILLCSHKKRDNRCAIAAPKLEHGLTVALEREGWEVHTQLDDPSEHGSPLEELAGTDDERDAEYVRRLQAFDPTSADPRRALILKVSHIGGHKFAGNVIIYKPQGVSVWYGRVTPHHCEAIVRDTIVGGKVLPPLLRGGLNLARPGRASLNDW